MLQIQDSKNSKMYYLVKKYILPPTVRFYLIHAEQKFWLILQPPSNLKLIFQFSYFIWSIIQQFLFDIYANVNCCYSCAYVQ
jgi:hypothetical protein